MENTIVFRGGILALNIFAYYFYNGTISGTFRRLDLIAKNVPEISAVLIGLYLLHQLMNNKLWQGLVGMFSALAFLIYTIQFIFLSQNGEYMTKLALENIDQAYLFLNTKYVILLVVLILCAVIIVGIAINRNDKIIYRKKIKIGIVFFIMFLLTFYQNAGASNVYIGNMKYFKHGHISPICGFITCGYEVANSSNHSEVNSDDYIFYKNWVYKNNLPYASITAKESKPNVIVIFTEGTSARLLDCYGGQYEKLTPNIDDFARHSMKVDNYYNHTSATFRGTLGQLASCYPYRGGADGPNGWNKPYLQKLNYSTLPKILDDDYNTYFFSPHTEKDGYTNLMRVAGFSNIFTRESVSNMLNNTNELVGNSIKDNDMYKALTNFMLEYDEDKPFFIAMYTFGTHTGFDSPADGVLYADGSNSVLNTLHNVDNSFGEFWRTFMQSKFKDNTIIIFTADHCHYYDKPFVELMKKDPSYQPYFVDRIPLIIYDPTHKLPNEYDAHDDTSLALAPTVLQLLNYNNINNAFLGTSIFENEDKWSIHAEGKSFWYIKNHRIFTDKDIPLDYSDEYDNEKGKLLMFYANEKNNSMMK